MFSPEFMRFLINYQKSDFTPEQTKKEIPLKINKRGKLAWVNILVSKQVSIRPKFKLYLNLMAGSYQQFLIRVWICLRF